MRRGILRGVMALGALFAAGQIAVAAPSLKAYFAADSVGIGEHITLTLEVDQDRMQVVAFPDFDPEQSEQLEIVGEPVLDTMSSSDRRMTIRRHYKFRSFEPGRYNMGKMSVLYLDKNVTDTLYTADSLRFTVGMFHIDSTSHAICDLKLQRDLPFKFEEVSTYTMWGVIALLLLILAVYIALRIMARMGHSVFGLFKAKPPIPPHVAAIAALEALRSEHLWQTGEYKGYYSRLTDILRTYISGRYGVAAMEMTTPEIIAASKELELPRRCEMELQELLRDADLVKFAKAEFEASQNERYFETARLFVDLTKPEEEEPSEESAEGEKGEKGAESSVEQPVEEPTVESQEVASEQENEVEK